MNMDCDKDYFEERYSVLDKNRMAEDKERLDFLKKYLPSKSKIKILDVGCGMGYYLNACDQENWETFGVDISQYALEKAKNYTKARLYQLDLNYKSLPFSDNFFDAITAFDFIEHLRDDKLFVQEVKRVLKKDNGIALFLSPNGHSKYDTDHTHFNIYSQNKLLNMLRQASFTIIHSSEFRGYTQRIIPLRRYRPLNWLNKRLCDLFGCYVKEVIVVFKK